MLPLLRPVALGILCAAAGFGATLDLGTVTVTGFTFHPWNSASTRMGLNFSATGFTADLYDYTSAQITLVAPAGKKFSVEPPAGAGVSFEGAFYYRVPGAPLGPLYSTFSAVDVDLVGMDIPDPGYAPYPTGRIDYGGQYARFNATDITPRDVSFTFDKIVMTWTWPQIPDDPGSFTLGVDGPPPHFHFYSGSELEGPFVRFVDAEVATVPEPATWMTGVVGLGLAALMRRRAARR